MRHAAKKRQEAIAAPVAAAACLHLQRGSSSQTTLFLEDVPGGTSVSIGADPSCDWQISAAAMPPHALSVLLLSGNLFVRSTCAGDVLLDGSPLGDSWIAVQHAARLDIGFAQIAIARGAARSAFDGKALGTLAYDQAGAAAQLAAARQELGSATRLGFPTSSQGGTWLARGSRPAGAERVLLRIDGGEPIEEQQAVLNRHSRSFAPSLLGDDRRGSSGVWLYILAGLATLFAYAGWVVALDQF